MLFGDQNVKQLNNAQVYYFLFTNIIVYDVYINLYKSIPIILKTGERGKS